MAAKGSFRGYWRVYGGLGSLLRSSYFWIALVITILTKPYWATMTNGKPEWVELTVDIVPSLLGFSLGGMAIMLSFSTGRFLEAIRQKGKDESFFMKVIASFFHFILVLGASLILAIVSKAFPSVWLSAFGFFATIYGLMLAIALMDHLWQTARIFNKAKEPEDNDNSAGGPPER